MGTRIGIAKYLAIVMNMIIERENVIIIDLNLILDIVIAKLSIFVFSRFTRSICLGLPLLIASLAFRLHSLIKRLYIRT